MSKSDWLNVFFYFHIIGFTLILALPISAIMMLRELATRDFKIVVKLGEFLGRMDRVAQVGSLLVLISGIGQMWANNITLDSLRHSQYTWLGVKIILFALLVVNGAATAGPAIRQRIRLLRQVAAQGEPTPEQEVELAKSATYMRITGIPQMVLLIAILYLAVFKPFQ